MNIQNQGNYPYAVNALNGNYEFNHPDKNNPYSKLEQSLAECKALSEGLKAISEKNSEAYSKFGANLVQQQKYNNTSMSQNQNFNPLKNSA